MRNPSIPVALIVSLLAVPPAACCADRRNRPQRPYPRAAKVDANKT